MQSLYNLVNNIVNWQYFGIFAIIWTLTNLIWVERWTSLIKRAGKLLVKPLIFKEDTEPHEPPLYPRIPLEQLASSTRRAEDGTGRMAVWVNAQRDLVFDPQYPLRSIGYVISLVLFSFFLIADAIVIANTLVIMGLVSPDLPPILLRLDYAILGGAVLTTIVGVWMLVDLSGKGKLISADLTDTQKRLLKLFSAIGILLSVVVMLALAVQRLINLGFLQSSPTTDLILSFILYGLLAINNSLSAALTFESAASGVIVVLYLLFVIFPVLAFIIDIFGRPLYIIIDVILWALFTPIIAIPYWFGKLVKMFTNM
jgi:MFS family permease